MRILPILLLSALMAAPAVAGDTPKGGKGHGEHRQKVLDKFDTNKDGKLDDGERAAARAASQAKLGERFAKLDTNGDGSLSRDEFMNRSHHDGKGKAK